MKAMKITPIRIQVETLEQADSLVDFVRKRLDPKATRSTVIRLCLEKGLLLMGQKAREVGEATELFKS